MAQAEPWKAQRNAAHPVTRPLGLVAMALGREGSEGTDPLCVSDGEFRELERELDALMPTSAGLDGWDDDEDAFFGVADQGSWCCNTCPRWCTCCCATRLRKVFCGSVALVLTALLVALLVFAVELLKLRGMQVHSCDLFVDVAALRDAIPFTAKIDLENPCALHVVVREASVAVRARQEQQPFAACTVPPFSLTAGRHELVVASTVQVVHEEGARAAVVQQMQGQLDAVMDLSVTATVHVLGIPWTHTFTTSLQELPQGTTQAPSVEIKSTRLNASSPSEVLAGTARVALTFASSPMDFPSSPPLSLTVVSPDVVADAFYGGEAIAHLSIPGLNMLFPAGDACCSPVMVQVTGVVNTSTPAARRAMVSVLGGARSHMEKVEIAISSDSHLRFLSGLRWEIPLDSVSDRSLPQVEYNISGAFVTVPNGRGPIALGGANVSMSGLPAFLEGRMPALSIGIFPTCTTGETSGVTMMEARRDFDPVWRLEVLPTEVDGNGHSLSAAFTAKMTLLRGDVAYEMIRSVASASYSCSAVRVFVQPMDDGGVGALFSGLALELVQPVPQGSRGSFDVFSLLVEIGDGFAAARAVANIDILTPLPVEVSLPAVELMMLDTRGATMATLETTAISLPSGGGALTLQSTVRVVNASATAAMMTTLVHGHAPWTVHVAGPAAIPEESDIIRTLLAHLHYERTFAPEGGHSKYVTVNSVSIDPATITETSARARATVEITPPPSLLERTSAITIAVAGVHETVNVEYGQALGPVGAVVVAPFTTTLNAHKHFPVTLEAEVSAELPVVARVLSTATTSSPPPTMLLSLHDEYMGDRSPLSGMHARVDLSGGSGSSASRLSGAFVDVRESLAAFQIGGDLHIPRAPSYVHVPPLGGLRVFFAPSCSERAEEGSDATIMVSPKTDSMLAPALVLNVSECSVEGEVMPIRLAAELAWNASSFVFDLMEEAARGSVSCPTVEVEVWAEGERGLARLLSGLVVHVRVPVPQRTGGASTVEFVLEHVQHVHVRVPRDRLDLADGDVALVVPPLPFDLHLPALHLSIETNGTSIGVADTKAAFIPAGSGAGTFAFAARVTNAAEAANMANECLRGHGLPVGVAGEPATGGSVNIVQSMLQHFAYSHTFGGSGLPFSVEEVSVGTTWTQENFTTELAVVYPHPHSTLLPQLLALNLTLEVEGGELGVALVAPEWPRDGVLANVTVAPFLVSTDPSRAVVLSAAIYPHVHRVASLLSAASEHRLPAEVVVVLSDESNPVRSPIHGVQYTLLTGGGSSADNMFTNVRAAVLGAKTTNEASFRLSGIVNTTLQLDLPSVALDVLVDEVKNDANHVVGTIRTDATSLGRHDSSATLTAHARVPEDRHLAFRSVFEQVLDGEAVHVRFRPCSTCEGQVPPTVLGDVINEWAAAWELIPPAVTSSSSPSSAGVSVDVVSSTRDELVLAVGVPAVVPSLPFPVQYGDLRMAATIEEEAFPVLTVTTPGRTLAGGNTTFAVKVVLSAKHRSLVEAFVARMVAGKTDSAALDGWMASTLPSEYDDLHVKYHADVHLPTGASPSSASSLARCIEMVNVDVGYLSLITNACSFTASVRAWFDNPTSFDFTILAVEFDVYFDNPTGVGCVNHVGCMFKPQTNVLLAHVSQPDRLNPVKGGLPVHVQARQSASVTIPVATQGSSDALCFRLATEYEWEGRLVLHIRNGKVTVKVGQFVVSVGFDVPEYIADKADANKPCKPA